MRSWLVSGCVCLSAIVLSSSCSSTSNVESGKSATADLPATADLASAKQAYEKKDYSTAAKEYTALAEQGNEEAQLALGKMFMMGEGVQRDRDAARRWFTMLATRGNPDAQFFLGSMLLLPQEDVQGGVKWLRLSAAQGMQDAQYLLGKAYMKGATAIPQDRVQGSMWLRLAAKDNHQFYKDELSAAEKEMSADEIGKAKALAEQWKPVSRANATPGD